MSREVATTLRQIFPIYYAPRFETGRTFTSYGETYKETFKVERRGMKTGNPTYHLSFFDKKVWRHEHLESDDLDLIAAAIVELYPTCGLVVDPVSAIKRVTEDNDIRRSKVLSTKDDNVGNQAQLITKWMTDNKLDHCTNLLTANEFHMKYGKARSVNQLAMAASNYYKIMGWDIKKRRYPDDHYTYNLYEERVLHAVNR